MYHVSLYNVCFERKMLQLAVSIVITIDNLDLLYRAKSNFFGILFIIFIVYIMFFFLLYIFFYQCSLCDAFLSLSQCHQTVMPMSLSEKALLS